MQDLRSFLDLVRQERPRELVEVKRLVSPKYVTTAILTKLEQAFRFPTLLFHKLEGSPFPTVTNVCGSKARLALALRCSVGELSTAVGMEQPAVSNQLRLLRALGLVAGDRNGRNIVYRLYDNHVAQLLDEAVYHIEHLRLVATEAPA